MNAISIFAKSTPKDWETDHEVRWYSGRERI